MQCPSDDRTSTLRARVRQYGLAIVLVAIVAGMSVYKPSFRTSTNLINVVRQISINGILAVGVTGVLLTGGVDLSLGSVVALAGVMAAGCAHPEQWPVIVPMLVGLAAGAGCGAASGAIITLGRVPPFIATLGMMTIARGAALVVSEGKPVSNLSPAFCAIGGGSLLGVPVPIFILVLVALVSQLFLRHFRWGRYFYAVGGNERAARAAGINVAAIKLFAYTMCGMLAGLAGVVLAARITTGQPNTAVGYELDAIAAVVIGGTSLSGGVGGVGGTILGSLLLGVINNSLDQLGVPSYYQQIVKGVIIIGAVWLDQRKE